jgi:hypothetical protein
MQPLNDFLSATLSAVVLSLKRSLCWVQTYKNSTISLWVFPYILAALTHHDGIMMNVYVKGPSGSSVCVLLAVQAQERNCCNDSSLSTI